MKKAESSPNGKKTLWEKEKLFVMSNFSFYHSVFKRLVQQTCKNQGLFGKGLRPLIVGIMWEAVKSYDFFTQDASKSRTNLDSMVVFDEEHMHAVGNRGDRQTMYYVFKEISELYGVASEYIIY